MGFITDGFLDKVERKTNVSKKSILDIAGRLKDVNRNSILLWLFRKTPKFVKYEIKNK